LDLVMVLICALLLLTVKAKSDAKSGHVLYFSLLGAEEAGHGKCERIAVFHDRQNAYLVAIRELSVDLTIGPTNLRSGGLS
jgi:hypothetical protein